MEERYELSSTHKIIIVEIAAKIKLSGYYYIKAS